MKQTQKEWARYIQDEIKKNNNYDNYKHVFVEYKDYLEKCLLENPRDVEKVCQLAITYFTVYQDGKKSVNVLEEFLKKYSEALNDDEKAIIYQDLADLHEKDAYDDKKCKYYLTKLIEMGKQSAVVWEVLGEYYLKRKKYKKALKCFQEMEKFSSEREIEDDYNYGITLFYCSCFKKSKEMLLRCYEKEPESAGILYALALCLYYTNDKQLAEPILDKLLEKVSLEKYYYDEQILFEELLDLYYLYEKYDKCALVFEREIDKLDWEEKFYYNMRFPFYFYSLKQLGNLEETQNKFSELLQKHSKYIEDIESGKIYSKDIWSEKEINEFIEEEKSEIKKILGTYKKIMNSDYKPQNKKINLEKMYKNCYLVDCPIHQKLD
ncbi:phosphoheptose isomerase [Leptotrichia alba]|uniref:Phosphoheptose isomerase n=1 Tax=Leptotrichia alba TaxID=3239304 RepID=A0AB39V119_9FUSO